MTCDHCLQQLLPLLYDLLDPMERQIVAAHLENCPTCQEALKTAQEQIGLLAEAVKEPGTQIVFKAPVQTTPAMAPTVVMRRPFRPLAFVNRWCIAAALLLLIFCAGGALGWTIWRAQIDQLDKSQDRLAKAKEDLTKAQQDWAQQKGQTQKDVRAIQEQIDQLFRDWHTEENTARNLAERQRVQLVVKGPQVAQAGANNSYQVQMFKDQAVFNNFAQAPGMKAQEPNQQAAVPGMAFDVRAVNQATNKTVFQKNLVTQPDGKAEFILPSDIAFKPGEEVVLVFETRSPEGKPVQLGDHLKLVLPEYVTHLATDRPLYRPGETVRFRSLTLERFSLKPAQQAFHLRYRIVGPNNTEIFSKDVASQLLSDRNNEPIQGPAGEPIHGIGVGEFALPPALPGGQYTLYVSEVNDRFHEEKRSFIVHQWQAPRFNKELQFERSSYGPGEQVRVQARIIPVEGFVPGVRNNVQASAQAVVDGEQVPINNQNNPNHFTDTDGRIEFTFTLPAQIHKGVGVFTLICEDSGNHETLTRAIPIVARHLEVDFYPEGGDLIAGVPNRVYFQARTPANKPADIEASLLDDKNQVLTRFKTMTDEQEPGINQGLGSFTFTPQAKKRYSVRIESPIGFERPIVLPVAKDKGVVMSIPNGVVEDQIDVTLRSATQPRELLVGAYCRGRMLDHQLVQVPADKPTEVTLKPAAGVGGVYRVTVFEKLKVGDNLVFRPLAERLIYRKNSAKIEVAIESNQKTYQPGESVELTFQARNEKKEFVPAIAMVAVVDRSGLKVADEKTARSMPTHFLLTTELRNPEDLEHADILLGSHPGAAKALDLLLGCQGWRRFAEQDPQLFQRRVQQAKPPIFLANAGAGPQVLDVEQKEIEKLDQAFVAKAIDLQKNLADKEKQVVAVPGAAPTVAHMQSGVQAAEQATHQARERLREIRAFYAQFAMGGALLTLLFIGFFLISVGLRRLADGGPARSWLIIGVALLAFLFLASVVGTFVFMGENLIDDVRGRRPQPAPVVMAAPMAPLPQQNDARMVVPDDDRISDELAEAKKGLEKEAAQDGAPDNQKQLAQKKFVAKDLAMNNMQLNQNLDRRGNNAADRPGPQLDPDERELRRQGKYQTLLQKHLGRRVQLPAAHDPCIIREYAHQHKPRKDEVRRDFTETVYWHPVLVLKDGKANVKFDLSDSVTRFQVLVLSHTSDGQLGANHMDITSKLPFSVEPKAPIEVTNTDQITIPVAVRNESAKPVSATLSAARLKGLTLDDNAERGLSLAANQNKREVYHVKPSITEGIAVMRVAGRTLGASDTVERRFKVVQEGFPITGSVSGVLENGAIQHPITLPAQWIAGSLQVQAHFYPSPLAELQGGLEAMRREPTGCFEQSASSNYANVLILNYMKEKSEASPALEKHARQRLQSGYLHLTNFECIDPQKPSVQRGFDWFGGAAAPHEALTAYGLMQFRDMAKVYPGDDAMLRRTEKYLLDQRDHKGGFTRNPKELDRFGRASDPVTNAYIVWALTESGVKEKLDPELAALRAASKESKDPYFLALAGLSYLNRKKTLEGLEIIRRLGEFQNGDGAVDGAQTSITGSQGHDLLLETTALAVLGWLKADRPGEFNPNIQSAVKWLGQQRRGAGGFGATQATILALKAVLAHTQKNPKVMQGGEVSMMVRQTQVAPNNVPPVNFPPPGVALPESNRAMFSSRSQEPITLTLREPSALQPGKNLIQLNINGSGALPFTLTWSYRASKPVNEAKAPVQLTTKLSSERAKEGETVKLTARVENKSGTGQGMAVAIIGLPGGLALPDDFLQLKAYAQLQENGAKAGKISAWELRGRELVLYWRDLAPDAKIEVELDLICRLPGSYTGPASRAYLYYDADRKFWIEPLNIRIVEKD